MIKFSKKSLTLRFIASAVNLSFILSLIVPTPAMAAGIADLGLPKPGSMVSLSESYVPVIAKGLKVHPDNPILFDFIIDTGNTGLKSTDEALKKESERVIKYFLASLTTNEADLWVNLSPYEKDRTIPESLGATELGRDMLAQDYILKQLTASLIYPEKELGREFWGKVYAKAQAEYGSSEIPVNTFNKVWIVADRAKVYVKDNTAFVVSSHLKVMLEEDYLSMAKHEQVGVAKSTNNVGSQIVREVVLPELEREVNAGKNFANLRQIFNSMILATWYKNNLKEALLNQVYANKNKVAGVDVTDKTIKEQIYKEYLKAYKKGVFNYIKEDVNVKGERTPKKYFSGGVLGRMDLAMTSDPSDKDVQQVVQKGPAGDLVRVSTATPRWDNEALRQEVEEMFDRYRQGLSDADPEQDQAMSVFQRLVLVATVGAVLFYGVEPLIDQVSLTQQRSKLIDNIENVVMSGTSFPANYLLLNGSLEVVSGLSGSNIEEVRKANELFMNDPAVGDWKVVPLVETTLTLTRKAFYGDGDFKKEVYGRSDDPRAVKLIEGYSPFKRSSVKVVFYLTPRELVKLRNEKPFLFISMKDEGIDKAMSVSADEFREVFTILDRNHRGKITEADLKAILESSKDRDEAKRKIAAKVGSTYRAIETQLKWVGTDAAMTAVPPAELRLMRVFGIKGLDPELTVGQAVQQQLDLSYGQEEEHEFEVERYAVGDLKYRMTLRVNGVDVSVDSGEDPVKAEIHASLLLKDLDADSQINFLGYGLRGLPTDSAMISGYGRLKVSSNMAPVPLEVDIATGEAYRKGELKTSPIPSTDIRFPKTEGEIYDATKDSPENAELEEIGLKSFINGEGAALVLAAGGSSRQSIKEAPLSVTSKLPEGVHLHSKAAVPVTFDAEGNPIAYLDAFGLDFKNAVEAARKAAKEAGIEDRLDQNIFGFMSNAAYIEEHHQMLKKADYYGLSNEIRVFLQPLGAKYFATPADVEKYFGKEEDKKFKSDADRDAWREAKRIALEKALEIDEKYKAGDKKAIIIPEEREALGHDEFKHQMIATGEIINLYRQGKKWVFTKNIDNVAPQFNRVFFRILGHFLKYGYDFQIENSPRVPGQKGGTAVVTPSGMVIAEDANLKATVGADGKPVLSLENATWMNNAVGLMSLHYIISFYKRDASQSDEDFIKELESASDAERQLIAQRGRGNAPKLLDLKPSTTIKGALGIKPETNVWNSSQVAPKGVKVGIVGVSGSGNFDIDAYKLDADILSKKNRRLAHRFSATKQWSITPQRRAEIKAQLEKDRGRTVSDDVVAQAAESYEDNKEMNEDFIDDILQERDFSGILSKQDAAMSVKNDGYGGIDLNSANMSMQIEGEDVKIKFSPKLLEDFKRGDFSGVRPVIINIMPISNMNLLLGLTENEKAAKLG